MEIAKVNKRVEDHTFWIHSNSMRAAVQLLTDESIRVTYQLYCKDDAVVTIYIRPANDPSPNASHAPSHNISLAERRKASGRRTVSDIFIRPALPHIHDSLDALSVELLGTLNEVEKVTIDLGMGKSETFSKDYLIGEKIIILGSPENF